jgi:hypothetical protein
MALLVIAMKAYGEPFAADYPNLAGKAKWCVLKGRAFKPRR